MPRRARARTPDDIVAMRQARLEEAQKIGGNISESTLEVLKASMSSQAVYILKNRRADVGRPLVAASPPASPLVSPDRPAAAAAADGEDPLPAETSASGRSLSVAFEESLYTDSTINKLAQLSPRVLNDRSGDADTSNMMADLSFTEVVARREAHRSHNAAKAAAHAKLLADVHTAAAAAGGGHQSLSPEPGEPDSAAAGRPKPKRLSKGKEVHFWWPTKCVHPRDPAEVGVPGAQFVDKEEAGLAHPKYHAGQVSGTGFEHAATHNLVDTHQSPHRDRHLSHLRDMPPALRYENLVATRPVRTPSKCPPGVAGKGYIFRSNLKPAEYYGIQAKPPLPAEATPRLQQQQQQRRQQQDRAQRAASCPPVLPLPAPPPGDGDGGDGGDGGDTALGQFMATMRSDPGHEKAASAAGGGGQGGGQGGGGASHMSETTDNILRGTMELLASIELPAAVMANSAAELAARRAQAERKAVVAARHSYYDVKQHIQLNHHPEIAQLRADHVGTGFTSLGLNYTAAPQPFTVAMRGHHAKQPRPAAGFEYYGRRRARERSPDRHRPPPRPDTRDAASETLPPPPPDVEKAGGAAGLWAGSILLPTGTAAAMVELLEADQPVLKQRLSMAAAGGEGSGGGGAGVNGSSYESGNQFSEARLDRTAAEQVQSASRLLPGMYTGDPAGRFYGRSPLSSFKTKAFERGDWRTVGDRDGSAAATHHSS
eukprot:SAG22_NODE_65_length_23128_cov_51.766609_9_plen_713_part_00